MDLVIDNGQFIPVPGENAPIALQDKTATENGLCVADAEYDGLRSVNVKVPEQHFSDTFEPVDTTSDEYAWLNPPSDIVSRWGALYSIGSDIYAIAPWSSQEYPLIVYKFNKNTHSWEDATSYWEDCFSGFTADFSNGLWTDGVHYYYSYNDHNFIYNKDTGSWESISWTLPSGVASYLLKGKDIWSDGDDIYLSHTDAGYNMSYAFTGYTSTHLKLNKATNIWETMTWNGTDSFSGSGVWSDGEHIYANNYYDIISPNAGGPKTRKYVSLELDKSTMTWSTKSWSGIPSETTTPNSSNVLTGECVHRTGLYVFAAFRSSNTYTWYRLENGSWSVMPSNGLPSGYNNAYSGRFIFKNDILHKVKDSGTDAVYYRLKKVNAPENVIGHSTVNTISIM